MSEVMKVQMGEPKAADRWVPDVAGEVVLAENSAVRTDEYQAIGSSLRKAVEMRGDRGKDSFRNRYGAAPCF